MNVYRNWKRRWQRIWSAILGGLLVCVGAHLAQADDSGGQRVDYYVGHRVMTSVDGTKRLGRPVTMLRKRVTLPTQGKIVETLLFGQGKASVRTMHRVGQTLTFVQSQPGGQQVTFFNVEGKAWWWQRWRAQTVSFDRGKRLLVVSFGEQKVDGTMLQRSYVISPKGRRLLRSVIVLKRVSFGQFRRTLLLMRLRARLGPHSKIPFSFFVALDGALSKAQPHQGQTGRLTRQPGWERQVAQRANTLEKAFATYGITRSLCRKPSWLPAIAQMFKAERAPMTRAALLAALKNLHHMMNTFGCTTVRPIVWKRWLRNFLLKVLKQEKDGGVTAIALFALGNLHLAAGMKWSAQAKNALRNALKDKRPTVRRYAAMLLRRLQR